METTDDAFLGGRLALLQPRRGYRAGMDAVLAAATVSLKDQGQMRVLDVGAGVGTIGLCVARRLTSAHVVLMEREPELCEIAWTNVRRNQLDDRVRVVQADVAQPAAELTELGVASSGFDYAVVNPPFMTGGDGTEPPDRLKAMSHVLGARDAGCSNRQDLPTLEPWARMIARAVRPGGGLVVVHTAAGLEPILGHFKGRFGGFHVCPVYPRAGEPANRVLVHARKGSRAPLRLLAGLVMHGRDGGLNEEAAAIFRDGAALASFPPI